MLVFLKWPCDRTLSKVPHGLWLREATSVAVDSEDRVYVFNRGNMPMMVFDADGNLVDRWGNQTPFDGDAPFPGARNSRWRGTEFIAPHAITIDHEVSDVIGHHRSHHGHTSDGVADLAGATTRTTSGWSTTPRTASPSATATATAS